MKKDPYNYTKIYVQVYCNLLENLETSQFLPSSLSSQDRAKADTIAKLAGIHTDAIVEYLMNLAAWHKCLKRLCSIEFILSLKKAFSNKAIALRAVAKPIA